MELWVFEDARQAAADAIHRKQASLWFPLAGLILVTQGAFLYFSLTRISDPLESLAKKAENDRLGFSFQSKSKLAEEDRLQIALERLSLTIGELEQQSDHLDAKLEAAEQRQEETLSQLKHTEDEREANASIIKELQSDIEDLNTKNDKLERYLDEERKAKVCREVEKRTEEIYEQMERAVEASALKAIWVPHFVHEVKSSARNIHRLSDRLVSKFEELSLARIHTKLEEILEHSENQLKELDRLSEAESPEAESPKKTISRKKTPAPSNPQKSEEAETTPAKSPRISLRNSQDSVGSTIEEDAESPPSRQPITPEPTAFQQPAEDPKIPAPPPPIPAPDTNFSKAEPQPQEPDHIEPSILEKPISLSSREEASASKESIDESESADFDPFDSSALDTPITLGKRSKDPSAIRETESPTIDLNDPEFHIEEEEPETVLPLGISQTDKARPSTQSTHPTNYADQVDLQSLVVQTLSCCPELPQNVEVKVSVHDNFDTMVSREQLAQSLQDLIEVSVFQTASGYIDLEVSRQGDDIRFSATSIGELKSPETLDLAQANRVAAMIEGNYDIDLENATGPRMTFTHPLATAGNATIELN